MQSGFRWERGPYTECPACRNISVGLLMAGGDRMTMRCSECRHTITVPLPPLDKKVIYLDQFVFSLLFNVETGGRLPPGHEAFSVEVHKKLRRLVLLQQVILPHSDLHRDETIVFNRASELRHAYEFFGGGVQLASVTDVELSQTIAAAEAYLAGHQLTLPLDVDDVLDDSRNGWLRDMHISVRSDYSIFADDLRRTRDETHVEMQALAAEWAREKPSFHTVLERETRAIATSKIKALERSEEMKRSEEPMASIDAHHAPIQQEVRYLLNLVLKNGVPPEKAGETIVGFWNSETCRDLPHHRISSYIFSGIARRVARGQKAIINRGLMNDVRALSTYAPYVDAMFVDKDCARVLAEEPLASDLSYKAKIFSLDDPGAFLAYLDELESATPSEVRSFAQRIYGIA